MRLVDLTGMTFGQLTVVQKLGRTPNGKRTVWECKCICGNTISCCAGDRLKKGRIVSCGCSKIGKSSKSWKGFEQISGMLWKRIYYKAVERDIKFDITIEEAWGIFESQEGRCKLSGRPLKLTFSKHEGKDLITASLDRIDSKIHYCKSNVQWIHKDINWMKNRFSQKYFISTCSEIYEHQNQLTNT
jgi:hypothetical protein